MEILSPTEAAEFLHISRGMLAKLQRQGIFEGIFYRVGTRIFYIKSKLQEWAMLGGTIK